MVIFGIIVVVLQVAIIVKVCIDISIAERAGETTKQKKDNEQSESIK